jgi:RNA polymerase sigma-70 factor (ECF subfamily)
VPAAPASAQVARVLRCLESLTGVQREAVTLAYYGAYTYREVAELLEMGLSTIKTRMRDGLIRMRDCVGDDGEDLEEGVQR